VSTRLSCADSSFPRLSHEAALGVIRDLEIPAVDVCVFVGSQHNPPEVVSADPEKAAEAVTERLGRAELDVADVFAIWGFEELAVNHPDPQVRAESLRQFQRVLEFARLIGSPGLTLLPGMPFDGVELDESLSLSAAQLQRRAELAGDAGLLLSIEPHYGSIVETPALTLELLDRAPDLWLALDHSHFVYQGIAQDDVDVLFPRSRHVHLRQAAEGAMQTPTNEGAIDFVRLRDRLEARGYEGYLALEFQWEEWMDCRRVDCISETAELRDLLRA